MQTILNKINRLKQTPVKKIINTRVREFEKNQNIFNELCFCLLTANYNAEKAITIQDKIRNGFSRFSRTELAEKLRRLGYRYPNKRAEYIVEARNRKKQLLQNLKRLDAIQLREWLVKNIKGLGYKEASHFLRNIGYKSLAIIDFHIIDILVRHKIIQEPKTLTKNRYLEIENTLRKISGKLKLPLSELDLYLWYSETGKVLK